MQVLDEVDALQIEHGKLSQQLQGYAKDKEALQAWGNFDPAGVRKDVYKRQEYARYDKADI